MTVQEKMSRCLNDVLNETGYLVKILNQNHYSVYLDNVIVLDTLTTTDVFSHWNDCVKNIIATIINDKIKKALNEI